MFSLSSDHHSERTPELDGAVHFKRSPSPSSMTHIKLLEDTAKSVDDTLPIDLSCTKSMSPDDRYSLWKFQQRYREFVASTDLEGASALIADVYHDDVVHMMDGVPMNKSALLQLHLEMLKRGTTKTVQKFRVVDSNHIEVILHTKNGCMDFYGRSIITLKDNKIIRVEKIESAEPAMPLPYAQKFFTQYPKAA